VAQSDVNALGLAKSAGDNQANAVAIAAAALRGEVDKLDAWMTRLPLRRVGESRDMAGSLTCGRAGTAYQINPTTGYYEQVSANVARFQRMSDGRLGLLVEPAFTQLLTAPTNPSDAAWTRTNLLADVTGRADMLGTSTAAKVVPSTVGGNHDISQAIAGVVAGEGVTVVLECRADGLAEGKLLVDNGAGDAWSLAYNLTTLAITSTTGTPVKTEIWSRVGGFVGIRMTQIAAASGSYTVTWRLLEGAAGDGSSGVVLSTLEGFRNIQRPANPVRGAGTQGDDAISLTYTGNVTKPTASGGETMLGAVEVVNSTDLMSFTTTSGVLFSTPGASYRALWIGFNNESMPSFLYGGSLTNDRVLSTTVLAPGYVLSLGYRRNGSTVEIFIDGAADGSGSTTTVGGAATSIKVGGNWGLMISDFRFYARALSDAALRLIAGG